MVTQAQGPDDGTGRADGDAPPPSTEELFDSLSTGEIELPRSGSAHLPAHALGSGAGVGGSDDGSGRGAPGADGYVGGHRGAAPTGVLAPSRVDPVARLASQVVGGPAGSRVASATGFWRAATVLVLFAIAMMGLAVVERQHCRAEGWSSPDQFFHLCYSDIPVIYGSAGLGGPQRPSFSAAIAPDGSIGQPPLSAALLWVVSAAVPEPGSASAPRFFFDLSAALLAGALVVGVGCVSAAAGRRRWDAAHLALAPIVVTAGLVSYDLFAVALGCAAVLAWSRDRMVTAGILLGLAVAVRPTYAVLGVALLGVALRAGVAVRAGAALATAALAYLGLRVLLLPGWSGDLGAAFASWRAGEPGYGSLWLVPQMLSGSRPANFPFWYSGGGLGATWSTVLTLAGYLAVALGVVVLALSSRRRPRVAHLALLAVAGVLLVSKAVPVQASLLLLPFVAWAGLKWRDHLIWASAEVVYFGAVWLYIGGLTNADRALPGGLYLILMLVRLAGIGWLAWQAVRAIREPLDDPVRHPEDGGRGVDDPLGGPAAGMPDALLVRIV